VLDRYRKVRDIITKSIDLGLKSPILCPSFERKPRLTKEKRFEKDLYLFSFSYPWLIRILHAAIAVLHSSSQKASRSFITPRISALLSVVRTAVLLRKHHVWAAHAKCTTLFVQSVDKTARFHLSLAPRKKVESQFYVAIVSQLSAGNLPSTLKKRSG
jgi:hypothetical protein